MGGELDAELRGSSAGLARVGCVGADKRGSCLVKGFCRVGLLHRVIADREGVKLALHDGGAGRKRDKQIGTAIARATDAHHRETIGYEERGNKPLVVRTGVKGREAVAFFEVAAVLRGSLFQRGTGKTQAQGTECFSLSYRAANSAERKRTPLAF